jgi:Uncharacterized conserved protein (COG2071)
MLRFRLDAVIERRLLLNYRADPDVVTRVLPAPFRPQLRNGYAVVGICLLRMGRARPVGMPLGVGFGSENAAHRFAVDWDAADGPRSGLFMPRLDSASRLNVAAGGRLFPGVQHRAEFDVAERPDRLRVAYAASDGTTAVDVEVWTSQKLVGSALFDDAADASEFFRLGSAGYSAGREPDEFEGMELATSQWRADPCVVDRAASSFFDNRSVFPAGSIELDSALVMREIPARWTALVPLQASRSN